MRILHTSDWHLGRSLGEHRLIDEQRSFLTWLPQLVEHESVDLVVVAGDVFDRAIPPAEAVTLLRDALGALRSAGTEVAMISGNHDSAERLAAYDGLTDAAGVLIRGGYPTGASTVVRTFGGDDLAIVAVPYLDPVLAPPSYRPTSDDDTAPARPSHEAVLRQALDQARATIGDMPAVAIAHAFVTGGSTSESERELSIGTATQVGADLFDGFTYTALGHLHQPQQVDGRDEVRYSGTPYPYSFSETRPKGIALIDIDGPTAVVRTIPVPPGRPVATVRGALEELVDGTVGADHHDSYVRVELTDPGPVLDARRRLDSAFTHVVEIDRVGAVLSDLDNPGHTTSAEIRTLTPVELAERFWTDVSDDEPDDGTRALLADVLDEADRAGAAS